MLLPIDKKLNQVYDSAHAPDPISAFEEPEIHQQNQ